MYERDGVSVIVVPGALLAVPTGFSERPDPIRAPPPTQRAINCFSDGVRIRCDWPRYSGESWPGIHGGMRPSFVITRIPFACAFADFADSRENGAIPPGVWHPAHFSAKIGATFAHVGAALCACCELLLEPAAIATMAAATAATAAIAKASLERLTTQS
jgi:hypothetical protein